MKLLVHVLQKKPSTQLGAGRSAVGSAPRWPTHITRRTWTLWTSGIGASGASGPTAVVSGGRWSTALWRTCSGRGVLVWISAPLGRRRCESLPRQGAHDSEYYNHNAGDYTRAQFPFQRSNHLLSFTHDDCSS